MFSVTVKPQVLIVRKTVNISFYTVIFPSKRLRQNNIFLFLRSASLVLYKLEGIMNVLKSTLDSGLPKKISVCTLDAGSPTPYFQCYVNIIVTCIAE